MYACSYRLYNLAGFRRIKNKDLSPYIIERNAFRYTSVLSIHNRCGKTVLWNAKILHFSIYCKFWYLIFTLSPLFCVFHSHFHIYFLHPTTILSRFPQLSRRRQQTPLMQLQRSSIAIPILLQFPIGLELEPNWSWIGLATNLEINPLLSIPM